VILLDTSVVSTVLRRRKAVGRDAEVARKLGELMASKSTLGLPGLVLQEVLSGIRDQRQFEVVLRTAEAAFPILLAGRDHHILAAQILNACRQEGITVSTPDALIAAQAISHDAQLFTTDPDFRDIARSTRLRLLPR